MSWINEQGPESDVVLSSRVRLARNIAGIPFPSVMDTEAARRVVETVKKSIMESNSVLRKEFVFVPMNELPPLEREMLVEKHLISSDLIENPEISALLLDNKETVSIMINEEDHIRMQCILPGYQAGEAWEILDKVDDVIEERVEYCFDEQLGYLTACPTNVGTGMRASIMMHLPALSVTGQMDAILHTLAKIGLTVRGLYGEGSESVGNIYQISNQVTLGISEDEIIHNVSIAARQIIDKERKARWALMDSDKINFEDKIWRSLGIISHARKMNLEEFMTLISNIRLGVGMGIIPDIDFITLNKLMIAAQPANLQKYAGRKVESSQLDIMRAEIARSMLKR